MSENRKIEVTNEVERWQEGDRDVKIIMHYNGSQSTSLLLNREEALKLSVDLSNYLYWLERDEEEGEES